ncbi:MAG TPA: ATP-binding protein [Terriglobales bacterium]|nr:ATP-binding protein [Terriglobales bacterium]
MSPEPTTRKPGRRRVAVLIALAIGIFLLFAVVFSQAAFNLTFLRPSTSEQTLIFTAVSALIFLLLVALTFVLLRNLLKLFAERRGGVLGSKFRTKMVVGALMLSFAPVIFLFLFAYGLMNRSIDKWFSSPVEEMRENAGEIAELVSSYAARNAQGEAAAIAASPETQRAFETGNFSGVMSEFRRHEPTLKGGFALAVLEDHAVASFRAPEAWPVLRTVLPKPDASGRLPREPFAYKGTEYMLGEGRVLGGGRILVAMPLPENFSATLKSLEESRRKSLQLSAERKMVRRTYMGMLWLLTVLVLFAATWFALFLSRLVTRPVAALAEATQQISAGHLDYRVEVAAADELGELVASFNRMAAELEQTRRQIESSRSELAQANVALEERRRHMETILESTPTGVLSLDAQGRVTRANQAFERMFAAGGGRVTAGSPLRDLFPTEVSQDLQRLLRKADRMGSTSAPMEIATPRARLEVMVTAASLDADSRAAASRLGHVLVFEDLSELLRAQKQAAWREVARRVAHEIKNPLTPIALSAERIRRHLERGTAPDSESIKVIDGCAQTIGEAVETVRTLVDEFSTLARFPASQPQPANVNAIVESALALFNGRLDGVNVRTFLAADLPAVMADPEALKRALANLVDNACEAMQGSMVREVHISTALVGKRDAVEIVVADTGHGVTPELKERLFLPYFSTKKRGTGLGLAIVSRIVEDHHGSIRVEENAPLGARFIIELPVATNS